MLHEGAAMREDQHDNVVRRVQSEFSEMPGLQLTNRQAERLWALDRESCLIVLDELVTSGFLKRDTDGRYSRTSTDPVRSITRTAKVHPRAHHDAA